MGVESELPIPMPEIPPPDEQNGRSQPRRVMASSNPAQWQWGMYNNVARHNAFQAAQSQQAYAAWQQYYQNLYQTRHYPMQSSYQAAPQVNAMMYSDMYQRPIASPNQAWQHTYPTSYAANPAPSASQLDQQNSWRKKSNPPNNTYCNAGNGWEWLQPQVPQDPFALFGETLLCPIKVFVYVLQELFRN